MAENIFQWSFFRKRLTHVTLICNHEAVCAHILEKDFLGIVQSPFLANGCHNVKFCDIVQI